MAKANKASLAKKIKNKMASNEYSEYKKLENNIKKDFKVAPDNKEISLDKVKNLFKAKEYTAIFDDKLISEINEFEKRINKINDDPENTEAESPLETQTTEIEKIIDSIKN